MKNRIYIFNSGVLKRSENTLIFTNEKTGKKKVLPVEAIDEIIVFGELDINKRLLDFLNTKRIVIHFFNYYGYYIGTYYPREYLNSGLIILKQVEHYICDEKRLELAKKFVKGSIDNFNKNIKYYNNRKDKNLYEIAEKTNKLKEEALKASNINELRAIEGNARKLYYNSFNLIINSENFKMNKRDKRPPKNPINALLSFGNSLMYSLSLSSIYHTNLDPRIGYLHETNTRSFTLNLDLAEIFKPVITDRIIFSLVNKRMIKVSDFESAIDYCIIKDKGRQIFVNELEDKLNSTIKLKKLNKKVRYRRLIQLECYKLYKHFLGEETYKPFISEW